MSQVPHTPEQSARPDWIPATHVLRELKAAGFSDRAVPYHELYRGILNGTVPAEQRNGNRWSVKRADLPQVAAALRMRSPQSVAA